MPFDADREGLILGVAGGGAMGRGIAQVAVVGGITTRIYDATHGVAEDAQGFIARMLDRQVEKNAMTAAEAAAAKARLSIAAGLDDFADCDIVIEAIVEDLDIKQQLFHDLEAIVRPDVPLVSNTSSLRIAAMAAVCEHRGRVAGMHFFNPVPPMKLVEIIAAPDTDPAIADALGALGRRMGRTPVRVKDGPGFLVNLGGRAYTTEGLKLAHERVATPAQIDAVMRDCCGFRLGPFELMDLTGMDVNFPASMAIYNGYFQDRRLATWPEHEGLFVSRRLGRKTGSGHYDYDTEGKKIGGAGDEEITAEPCLRVTLAEPDDTLAALLAEAGAAIANTDNGTDPIVGAPVGEDCTTFALRTGADHRRLIAVDLSGDRAKRLTVMTAPGADLAVRDQLAARLARTGAAITRIADSPGFIAQRLCAMMANLGCEIAQLGIAEPADIDTAMKLGLNYPFGPLELADHMGTDRVLTIMTQLQDITGDDRYRPSLWLRRRALLGLKASDAG